jgi:molybdate transport system regulatory protein
VRSSRRRRRRHTEPVYEANFMEALMRLSARNQLNATVESLTHGEVMSTVKVTLGDGQSITAAITKEAAEDLGFTAGEAVTVIIKSTEVMLAKD